MLYRIRGVPRTRSRRFLSIVSLSFVIAGLLAVNVGMASAHNWRNYHWDKSGSQIVIRSMISGSTAAQAEAARVDARNKISILRNYRSSTHTDVSVFDANSGATGWAGLATTESRSWGWHCQSYCHITHAHAQVNTYYRQSSAGYQGIHCQEVFHAYGFDHSDTGDCMGKGYYASGTNYYGPHNSSDFYNRYRNH